jgi:molecular chaperone HtpG
MSERPGEEAHPIQIHVPGVLKVLGEALYSKPLVALRELLQNAQDSIVRRRNEHRGSPDDLPPGRVHVQTDRAEGRLLVRDNGSGLTEAEIHEFLATVGRGYTGQMRGELELLDPDKAMELIGQFGLGLLSSFLIADAVVIDTLSATSGDALRWRATGDGTYTIGPGRREEPGTTVQLQIKPSRLEALDERMLRQAIRTYADFLSLPILLNDDPDPVNAMRAPWHTEEPVDEATLQAFLTHRYPQSDFLEIIPLRDARVRQGRDTVTLPLRGVLAIPAQSHLSTGEHGQVSVYIRRMLVEENCRELLPPWAKFVMGVVESPALQPTASRESVRRDTVFSSLRDAIGALILRHLQELSRRDRDRFGRIVGVHNALIKAWALQFPDIFPIVAELAVFETGQGRLTLPEIHERIANAADQGQLQQSWKDRPLYYIDDRQTAAQARLLLESRGIPVIDASHGWEHLFLEHYAELHMDVELVRLQAGERSIFMEPTHGAKTYRNLVEACEALGIRAVVAEFSPRNLPALLVLDEQEQQVMSARRLAERVDVIGQLRDVVEELAGQLEDGYTRRGILYLNAHHSLIQRLAVRDADDESLQRSLSLLYAHAALLEQRSLTRDGVIRLFSESADALRHFLRTS